MKYCAVLLSMFQAVALAKVTVELHTDSARAVLEALRIPDLARSRALEIAAMDGNQAIIRKLNEFKIPVTTGNFAAALVTAARGQTADTPEAAAFSFASVKGQADAIAALLQRIEEDHEGFTLSVQHRVAQFTPENVDLHLEGHIVVGGDGGGYSFGGPVFFLNLAIENEFAPAKAVLTHEMYHAVQGALTASSKAGEPPSTCRYTTELLQNVYNEGSATYVEDYESLKNSPGPLARQIFADLSGGIKHVKESVTLLELSLIGLSVERPVSHEDIYSLGFYGDGPLYNIGHVMAKAIAEYDGAQGLAGFLQRPAYEFALRYTKLPGYGADAEHPRLGNHTISELQRLAQSCK